MDSTLALDPVRWPWRNPFNENRLHSSIDYKTPLEAERDYYRHNQPRQQPLSGELTLH